MGGERAAERETEVLLHLTTEATRFAVDESGNFGETGSPFAGPKPTEKAFFFVTFAATFQRPICRGRQ
jgi:hypothetical protein